MRILGMILLALGWSTAMPVVAAPAKPPAKLAAKGPLRPLAKAPAKPAAPTTLPDTPQVQAVRRAFRFAFPIYEIMRTRGLQLGRAEAAGFSNAVNALLPRLTLADATTREITTPNNDTLYASAWLDLSQGPVVFSVPALPGRYNSAALMTVTSDVVAVLGTRTAPQGGRYAIVGPGYTGPAPSGTELVRSPTNQAWLLVRVVVNGKDDIPAASQAILSYTMAGPGAVPPFALATPPAPDGKAFLSVVNAVIAASGSSDLQAKLMGIADTGLGRDWDALTPDAQALWNRAIPIMTRELRGGLADIGGTVDGWSYPPFNIAEYGDDDDLRAKVALGGLAALPRVEAVYLSARSDATGAALDGSKSWRVRIPAGLPLQAFWSLTMYQQEADGRLFFVPNPLDRFAVGDRSRHLRPDRDGSTEIFVQAQKPSGERVVNWLPAPGGKFVLVFRAYLPKAPLLDGSFRLPPVIEGEMIP
ncbi:DUF1254 domain-containing protein [Sandarakinorhabdus sp.]|uniref:DUF1254 domain-containing protein n=1 Tax=Sandarakinorhabdus sp. TaxID=1916663 RepID=UPI00286DB712|nr:DUF1254 domain-containing protein [Sandarakinorhabdus sp.]